MQIRFTKAGTVPEAGEPPLLEDLKAFLESQEAPIEGQLLINIPHAKDLYANDGGKSSDPFCKILLPGNAKYETQVIPKTLTPLWKYKGTPKISLPKNVSKSDCFSVSNPSDSVLRPCVLRSGIVTLFETTASAMLSSLSLTFLPVQVL